MKQQDESLDAPNLRTLGSFEIGDAENTETIFTEVAEPSDLTEQERSEIKELLHGAFPEDVVDETTDLFEWGLEDENGRSFLMYLAKNRLGEIIGTSLLVLNKKIEGAKLPHACVNLKDIAVKPEYRQRGVARIIVNEALNGVTRELTRIINRDGAKVIDENDPKGLTPSTLINQLDNLTVIFDTMNTPQSAGLRRTILNVALDSGLEVNSYLSEGILSGQHTVIVDDLGGGIYYQSQLVNRVSELVSLNGNGNVAVTALKTETAKITVHDVADVQTVLKKIKTEADTAGIDLIIRADQGVLSRVAVKTSDQSVWTQFAGIVSLVMLEEAGRNEKVTTSFSGYKDAVSWG